ncbi:MAG: molybdenum cofactor guanylyltransferase [Sphingomicrobium sp.]
MIAVVVLAGGAGRRIGGDKPLQMLAGRSLLDHALTLAQCWSPLVGISVRESASAVHCTGAPYLIDTVGGGPIAGIASALAFGRSKGSSFVLTIPCDTPFLPTDMPKRLTEALSPPSTAVIAASGGRLHPSCGLWRVGADAALPAYLATGRSSLNGFAKALGAESVEWPVARSDPFFNINSKTDLIEAEQIFKDR